MGKKGLILFATMVIISVAVSTVLPVFAHISVGLEEGDWVRYEVTYTGTPPETYPTNTKIEITKIENTTITIKIENDRLNGTHTTTTSTFDLENGTPDLVIIPANLSTGDEVVNKVWNITFTIEGVAEYDFKDVTRQLVFANIAVGNIPLEYKWDRETGIFIQIDQTRNTFTQKYLAYDTNIVANQNADSDALLIYETIAAIAIIVILLTLIISKKKK